MGAPERLALADIDLASGRVTARHASRERPALFFDCDGVLNHEPGGDGVLKPEDVVLLPGATAVFGESEAPLHEDYGPLKPISFYCASKLGAEAYLSVYAHTFGIMTTIVRFANVVGERATHGILPDLLRKLAATPNRLDVLGDGRQQKPYLYVSDIVNALCLVVEAQCSVFEVYHAAGEGSTSVREIVEIVVEAAGSPETAIVFGSDDRGWPGDVPRFAYDTRKLAALGWRPRYASTEAVRYAVRRMLEDGL